MKRISIVFILFLCLIFSSVIAQKGKQCMHCNMNIQDELYLTIVENYNGAQMEEDFSLNLGGKYEVLQIYITE